MKIILGVLVYIIAAIFIYSLFAVGSRYDD
jgi:hypothetical protein